MSYRFRVVAPMLLATSGLALSVTANARATDPSISDCLTANEASIKLREEHKLRDARAQLLICSATACPADIRNVCMQRVGKVNDAIPTVVFEVRDASDNELTSVNVTMDGLPLVSRLEGTAISLDPGEHVFGFEATGQPPVEKHLVIHEGEKDRRERVVVGAAAPSPAPPVTPPKSPLPSPAPPPATATPPSPVGDVASPAGGDESHASQSGADRSKSEAGAQGGPSRIPAYLMLGIGGAGFAVTAIFGVLALGNKSALDGACTSGKTNCPTNEQSDIDSMHVNSIVSDVGLGVGVVAAGIGAILLLAEKGPTDAPEKTGVVRFEPWVGGRALGLRGSF